MNNEQIKLAAEALVHSAANLTEAANNLAIALSENKAFDALNERLNAQLDNEDARLCEAIENPKKEFSGIIKQQQ